MLNKKQEKEAHKKARVSRHKAAGHHVRLQVAAGQHERVATVERTARTSLHFLFASLHFTFLLFTSLPLHLPPACTVRSTYSEPVLRVGWQLGHLVVARMQRGGANKIEPKARQQNKQQQQNSNEKLTA